MKKIISLLFTMIMFLSAAMAENSSALSHEQLKEKMDANPYLNLIDIRDQAEYDAGHLLGSMNMPLDDLQAEMQAILDGGFNHMEVEVFLYGDTEEECARGVQIIKELGFNNAFYIMGIDSWPYKMLDTATETAQAQRILGGMEALDLNGNTVTEQSVFDHRLTMVNVWATYCNPCLQEMPDLGRISREMKKQGVQIIGIVSDSLDYYGNRDEKQIALAREIVSSTQADYLHLVPDMAIMRKLLPQITSVPTTFFLDQSGNLVGGVYLGSRNYDAWMAIVNDTLALLSMEEAAQ